MSGGDGLAAKVADARQKSEKARAILAEAQKILLGSEARAGTVRRDLEEIRAKADAAAEELRKMGIDPNTVHERITEIVEEAVARSERFLAEAKAYDASVTESERRIREFKALAT
jgi:uncharacterized coiled-coil DUF342 family protein